MLIALFSSAAWGQQAPESAPVEPPEPAEQAALPAPQEAIGRYTTPIDVDLDATLTAREVAEAPGSIGDPVRAIQNLPGLVRTPLDAGWLLVRGGYPDDTGLFLDGVRIPMIYHLGGLTSILHPAMIDHLDFYPGSTPPRLGRSLSGAAELGSRPLEGAWRAEAGLNLVFAHAFLETPLGDDAGMAFSLRRSYLDGVLGLVLDPERARIAPRFWDAEARIDSPQAGLLVVGLSDAAAVPADDGETSDVTQQAVQVQGRLENAAGTLSAYPWFRYQTRRIEAPGRVEQLHDHAPGLRVQTDLEASRTTQVQVGVESELHSYEVVRDADRFATLFGNIDPYAEVATGDRVRARLGLRADTLLARGQQPRAGLSPRLHLRARLTPELFVVAEAYRAHQTPNPVYLVGPDGPYLPLERTTGGTLGVRFTGAHFGLVLDGWLRRSDHLASPEADGSLGQLQGRAIGLDSTWRAEWERTVITLIYGLSSARLREEPEDAFMPTLYDQPHRVNLIALQRLPKQWTLTGRWRFGTGFVVPPDAVAYDILTGTESLIERDPRGRAAPYHALDLKVAKRVAWRRGRLDLYVDVQNVYNRRVPEPAINGVDDSIVSYAVGLPVLPIFGIDGAWEPPRRRGEP